MLSNKMNRINPSLTLELSAKINRMKSEGRRIYNFTVGEPDFKTPRYIINETMSFLDNSIVRYTDTSGLSELRELISQKLKNVNKINCTKDSIVVSTGAKQAIVNSLFAITNRNDDVLIPSPYWLSYPEMCKITDCTPVILPYNDSYKIDVKILDKYKTDKTKCLILNNPSNPTGVIYSKNELTEIGNWAVKNNIYIISDEIYERLSYDVDYVSIASISDEINDITITINGFSKSYAMTGFRLGYSCSNNEIAALIKRLQGHITSNANTISQVAGIAALKNEKKEVDEMIIEFKKRRDYITSKLDDMNLKYIYPEGAFYIFIKVDEFFNSTIKNSLDFCDFLLSYYNVALIPGVVFGEDNFVRMSYATKIDDIKLGISILKKFINEL
ncbi:pyridoxal phosphate-dependent aminotransferase [uncultured Finegoldia sp.]|uniref:pyridoxal phosphate-dependent aminotransferase n=1 Tax=uncultured Finegoldia sp. TaxID=328009 RepID=UPI0026387094|nr:pyridoxal phosphate-dependent aminotransferase [uncultured Finegoldia sp.]